MADSLLAGIVGARAIRGCQALSGSAAPPLPPVPWPPAPVLPVVVAESLPPVPVTSGVEPVAHALPKSASTRMEDVEILIVVTVSVGTKVPMRHSSTVHQGG